MSEFVEVMKQRRRMCKSSKSCENCYLNDLVHKSTSCSCDFAIAEFPEDAETIIRKWSSEHPIKTNADKFKEVFGIEVIKSAHGCSGIDYKCNIKGCDRCVIRGFWNREYIDSNNER